MLFEEKALITCNSKYLCNGCIEEFYWQKVLPSPTLLTDKLHMITLY